MNKSIPVVERRNPLSHTTTLPSGRQEVTAATIETASAYVDGFCPHCNVQMVSTMCGNIPAFVCLEHRTVLPVKE